MARDFFDSYFAYVGETEAPAVFHRWSIISCVGAALSRRSYIPLGHFKIYPSMYTVLVGSSGTRKTVSIDFAKKVLKASGYSHFAADKTSKEKFILDLMEKNHVVDDIAQLRDITVMSTSTKDAETFIVADELQDFMGLANLDFITMLGKLWDVRDEYEHRIKTGKSAIVYKPLVNILGGTTPTSFSLTFPPEILGQGFLSRMLLIYGEGTGTKIPWPRIGLEEDRCIVVKKLSKIRNGGAFTYGVSLPARELITKIYNTHITVNDPRFAAYETRRNNHLLKLCAIMCSLSGETQVSHEHVLMANTVLYSAERRMPLALGEFGKGKFSDVSNSIMEALQRNRTPQSLEDLWRVVAQDLGGQNDLVGILKGLQTLQKIQTVEVGNSLKFLPKRAVVDYFDDSLLLRGFLTKEEEVQGGM